MTLIGTVGRGTLVAGMLLALAACDNQETSAEKTGNAVEETAEKAGEAIEDAGEAAGEAVEETGEAAEEATQQ
jgi:hypothetical protein